MSGTDPEPYSFGGNPADFSTGEVFLSLGMSFVYTLACNQSDFHCGRANRFEYGGVPSDIVALTFYETLTGPYAAYGPATIFIDAPVDISLVTPVPEPTTWAMLPGFCGMGFMAYRRRHLSTALTEA